MSLDQKEILSRDLKSLRQGFVAGDYTCQELVQAHLDRIEKLNSQLNVMVHANPKLQEEAEAIDQRRELGGPARPLEAVPIAIKDMICTRGVASTAGSKILSHYHPPYSATLVERLQEAGALILGKCNQDEFAMGSSNENSAFGPCLNPWNTKHVPGGSSGGSAAAVASLMASSSIGTDTGGSIRQPASFCGVVGVKPTYGRISRYGVIAFASSLDQAGPMTRSVKDSALMLEVMCGVDKKDPTTSQQNVPRWSENLGHGVGGLRIGVPRGMLDSPMDQDVRDKYSESLQWLKDSGAQVVEVDLEQAFDSIPAYYVIATSEASSNLARYDGIRFGLQSDFSSHPPKDLEEFYSRTRGEGFGAEVKRRILLGTFALSSGYYDAYYKKACQVRRLIFNDYQTAFSKCDAILTPVVRSPAFKVGDRIEDPLAMYMNDQLTTGVNLAGLPAMSVPVGWSSEKLPIGMQVIANQFCEQEMLNVGSALEHAANIQQRAVDAIW
jgi:aspartyl-tRNA(Asn)/glutamyl-tRNA(Gln) amidotransferase subunit A